MDLTHPPEAGRIGPLQAGMLVIAIVLPTSVLYVPAMHMVAGPAGRDAWISILLATGVAVLLLGAVWYLSLRHPGRTYLQILEIEWGPWVGRTLAALYVIVLTLHAAVLARAFSAAVGLTILPKTPVLVIGGAQLAVAVYAARRGIEVIARVNEIATPLMLFSLVALFGLAWGDLRWDRLPPFFETPAQDVLRGVTWPLSWFLQATVLAEIAFPFVQGPRRAAAPLFGGILISGLFMTASVLVSMAVLGVYEAVHSIGLLEKLAREVRPIEFLSRTEALYLFFWQAAAFVELAAYLYAGTLAGAEFFRLRGHRPLAAPQALVVILLGSVLFRSIPDLIHFAELVIPIYAVLLGAVIPLLLLVSSFRPRPVGR